MLACPYCDTEIRLRELNHPGLFKNYRICPNCHGKFTPDTTTKRRQVFLLVIAFISLVLTILLYTEGMKWLIYCLISYVIFGLLLYWGNKYIFLVPYEGDQDKTNDT
jgi:hypothetical protein